MQGWGEGCKVGVRVERGGCKAKVGANGAGCTAAPCTHCPPNLLLSLRSQHTPSPNHQQVCPTLHLTPLQVGLRHDVHLWEADSREKRPGGGEYGRSLSSLGPDERWFAEALEAWQEVVLGDLTVRLRLHTVMYMWCAVIPCTACVLNASWVVVLQDIQRVTYVTGQLR